MKPERSFLLDQHACFNFTKNVLAVCVCGDDAWRVVREYKYEGEDADVVTMRMMRSNGRRATEEAMGHQIWGKEGSRDGRGKRDVIKEDGY